MNAELMAADCPLCHSAGSVVDGKCRLCEADFGESPGGAVDLPPAASSATPPLRFSDVIDELHRVGSLVSNAGGATELESACNRLQELLLSLRQQFLTDLVLAQTAISPPGPRRPSG